MQYLPAAHVLSERKAMALRVCTHGLFSRSSPAPVLRSRIVEPQSLQGLTSAVAPVVMVSAAGLLFNGVQTKHFHLSDRIRGLMAELRDPATAADRLNQITAQLALFDRRLRLNQRSL